MGAIGADLKVLADDMPVGSLQAGTGKTMRFTGTTVLKVENGLITEEVGLTTV
jgi:hypothetical protein